MKIINNEYLSAVLIMKTFLQGMTHLVKKKQKKKSQRAMFTSPST